MNSLFRNTKSNGQLPSGSPVNISRRGFLIGSAGATAGAFVLGFGLPIKAARAQAAGGAPGTNVPAFLELRPDNTVRLLSPFVEGGQGIFTGMAQIVGEEFDMDPASFVVENAPAGADYQIMFGGTTRITGGSMSTRMSYDTMRTLGALARSMVLEAAAAELDVPVSELTTEPGQVVHAASSRKIPYGDLASALQDMDVPAVDSVTLKDPADFRWIRKPVARLDVRDKSTGKAMYSIDAKVDGMLHAAVQHAPRLGMSVGAIQNEDEVKAMTGVLSVHTLPGAVAVVAERWWNAKRAVESLDVEWQEAGPDPIIAGIRNMPADFSSEAFNEQLATTEGDGMDAEVEGDAPGFLSSAEGVVSATYRTQYVRHAQLEPASALAQFQDDGSLDLWFSNQSPEMFQAQVANLTGLDPSQIRINSPLLGGFFGRHFVYASASPYPQAIQLAQETGRPVKVIWTREEESLRDPVRPMAAVRFRGALDEDGMPTALEAISVCSGPTEGINGHNPEKLDEGAVEGLTGKAYAIPNKRIAQIYVENPPMLAYWRSVGHSMNDFLYETFLDELLDSGGQDPYEARLKMLEGNERLSSLLKVAVEISGGWKRGPFQAEDGTTRARGIAMASPFGSHTAVVAEVSIQDGDVVVHDIWQAIDPGNFVNPAIIEHQVRSATALGLSEVLMEEVVYENGEPESRNYDMYPILPPDRMPRVHVAIIESGEPMGGIGEPGLSAVPPAVTNAVSTLTGQRIRSMPLSRHEFGA